ncbi:hypothetical protein AAVH_32320, partial [Aphelenchoides avenae]
MLRVSAFACVAVCFTTPTTVQPTSPVTLRLFSGGRMDETFQLEVQLGTPAVRLNLTIDTSAPLDVILSSRFQQTVAECQFPAPPADDLYDPT